MPNGFTTSTKEIYQTKESLVLGGRSVVIQGSIGQAHNRNINAASSTYASSTNSATWTAAQNITELEITPLGLQVSTVATDTPRACLVVYNAPSDAVAAAWLADTGSVSADILYDMVPAGTTLIRQFTDPVIRIDVLPIGTGNTTMRVVIGAN